jgi:hypothetical protein
MNIGEANAVNVLLRHVLDDTADDDVRLREASVYLAGQANKALGAGLRAEDIEGAWPS